MAVNDQINNLITELFDVRQKKSEVGKLEEAILEALKPLVDPKFDKLPDQPIVSGDIQFKRIPGENRTINAALLLERGVAPDIINYATKVTPYFQYKTHVPKPKG